MKAAATILQILAGIGFLAVLGIEFMLITSHADYGLILAVLGGGFLAVVILWALADALDLLVDSHAQLVAIAENTRRTAEALERRMQPRPTAPGASTQDASAKRGAA